MKMKKNLILQLTLASLVLNVITILLTCLSHSLDSASPFSQSAHKEMSSSVACEEAISKQLLSQADALFTSRVN